MLGLSDNHWILDCKCAQISVRTTQSDYSLRFKAGKHSIAVGFGRWRDQDN